MPSQTRATVMKILAVASGNFIEMYDFVVYGYYATYIAHAFFPLNSQFGSLMLSLMTFGAGYLMRPLGAIVLGAYIDRQGRKKGLILTLLLMAVGTLSLAATPSYQSIGILAPVIVMAGRLLQGLSAGVELGGVSVYLSEIATAGNRGFYTAWQSASQQVAVVFTALLGLVLTARISPPRMSAWGWRIPFAIGCAILPVLLWLRGSLEETEAFRTGQRTSSSAEVLAILRRNSGRVALGMLFAVLTTVTFYLITAYTPTFGKTALHLGPEDTFVVTLCVGISNFVWLPVGGALSDRFGSWPFLIGMPILCLVTAVPAMTWLIHSPSFSRLLLVELWYSPFYGLYNGAMIPFVIESMPQKIRTTGFALSYSLATALFGGFTPAVATFLIYKTGNKAAPAWWLSLAAALSLTAALIVRYRRIPLKAGQER
jgi:MFS transporter, MHS family, citrate/tricarballylate:H+ symporter